MKIGCRNKLITLFAILAGITLTMSGCKWTEPACELTGEDELWLLDEYDSLLYLKNGSDTVSVMLRTFYGQSSYDYSLGVPKGDNDHWGNTDILFKFSKDTISMLRCHVQACWSTVSIVQLDLINEHVEESFTHILKKDTLRSEVIEVNNVTYSGYMKFTNQRESFVKELYFIKEFGVVRLETMDGDLYELLPL